MSILNTSIIYLFYLFIHSFYSYHVTNFLSDQSSCIFLSTFFIYFFFFFRRLYVTAIISMHHFTPTWFLYLFRCPLATYSFLTFSILPLFFFFPYIYIFSFPPSPTFTDIYIYSYSFPSLHFFENGKTNDSHFN